MTLPEIVAATALAAVLASAFASIAIHVIPGLRPRREARRRNPR